jgi:hypothetical protein
MKEKVLAGITVLFLLFAMTGISQAALTTIGTASYAGSDYKLIWDDDNNGNSVVWLDYSNDRTNWSNQNSWAAGLDSSLTYNINPAYTVTWDDTAWRLPSTEVHAGPSYNQTSSEMGDLFYNDLGLSAGATTVEQLNATNFDNLIASWYWSGTVYYAPDYFYLFCMDLGYQTNSYEGYRHDGLAVRSGQVSAVPVPGALWLLGSGLAGLAILNRRKTKNRV